MRCLARLLDKNQYRKSTFLNTSQKLWVRKSTIYTLLQTNSLQLHTAARVKLTNTTVSIGNKLHRNACCAVPFIEGSKPGRVKQFMVRNTHIGGNTIKKNKEKVITKMRVFIIPARRQRMHSKDLGGPSSVIFLSWLTLFLVFH